MNDHCHRPKQEIVQKVIEAIGENPKECTSQEYLDKYSELDTVRDVFLAMCLDRPASTLKKCSRPRRRMTAGPLFHRSVARAKRKFLS